MPVIKTPTFIESYRRLAGAADVHEMSGRGGNKAFTSCANSSIIEKTAPWHGMRVLDVGCGDASLLVSLLKEGIDTGTGVVPTAEETARLRMVHGKHPRLNFHEARLPQLPFADNVFDRVICNGVFILLDDETTAHASLCELARTAGPGAKIWLGEVPEVDEISAETRAYGNSITRWLLHVLRKSGFRAFMRASGRVLRATLGSEPMVIFPKRCLALSPETVKHSAERCRLRLIWYGKHLQPDGTGGLTESKTRWDYLFEKAKAGEKD